MQKQITYYRNSSPLIICRTGFCPNSILNIDILYFPKGICCNQILLILNHFVQSGNHHTFLPQSKMFHKPRNHCMALFNMTSSKYLT